MKIYVAIVEALRKRGRQDETQFTTNPEAQFSTKIDGLRFWVCMMKCEDRAFSVGVRYANNG